ncbi:phosphoribosylaminoimidazole carboxylase ade2 [Trapelia coarctata]|nr:phosphoribosylaminoimidazole carboxylase ade2 [Trapelia coarctata]
MDRTVGVLGGGQLGRMLTEAANRLNIKVVTLDAEGAPAKQINSATNHVNGSFTDPQAIRKLAQQCDVLTVEIEHVDTNVLEELAACTEVQPSWRTIRVIQDKFKQKEHLSSHGIASAKSVALETGELEEVDRIGNELGYPLMLKSRTEAYDGRGNYPIRSPEEIRKALAALGGRPLYAEQWADFKSELAVMVVKIRDDASVDGWEKITMAYPVVETVHEDSICKLVYAPARNVPEAVRQKAQILAQRAVAGLWGRGVFGVEMFLLETGELLINEIAPRPHNSGHHTMEACPISQYDAHLRAVLDLPIPLDGTRFMTPDTTAIMINILGGMQPHTHMLAVEKAMTIPGARIHMYGKGSGRPGRKMGHVTVVAGSLQSAERQIEPLISLIDKIRAERRQKPQAKLASPEEPPQELAPGILRGPESVTAPLVAITMGSDSDRFVLKPAVELLCEFNIPHIVTITSAHRTPERMFKFAREAASRGIKVIIAAAGGAAHLPGMIAALTTLPVIGVPVRGSVLDGQDSLLSIVQMPRGCPVATVAINNSNNAAQLALRILGASDVIMQQRLEKYLANQTQTVIKKAEKMETVGFENYSWEE